MQIPTTRTAGARLTTVQLPEELRKKLLSGAARIVISSQTQLGATGAQTALAGARIVLPSDVHVNVACSAPAGTVRNAVPQIRSATSASSVRVAGTTHAQRLVIPALSSLHQFSAQQSRVVRPTAVVRCSAAVPTQTLLQRPQNIIPAGNRIVNILHTRAPVRAANIHTPAPEPTATAQPGIVGVPQAATVQLVSAVQNIRTDDKAPLTDAGRQECE